MDQYSPGEESDDVQSAYDVRTPWSADELPEAWRCAPGREAGFDVAAVALSGGAVSYGGKAPGVGHRMMTSRNWIGVAGLVIGLGGTAWRVHDLVGSTFATGCFLGITLIATAMGLALGWSLREGGDGPGRRTYRLLLWLPHGRRRTAKWNRGSTFLGVAIVVAFGSIVAPDHKALAYTFWLLAGIAFGFVGGVISALTEATTQDDEESDA